jgi:geranylgeranylglycerol-phosphate geranylgeranyltransferase
MALNDIYDVEIDKINSPNRPLVNGELKRYEALLFSLFLIGACEYVTFAYLPDNLKFIIQLLVIQIIIYTPILKKIPLLKNISCASLVSFSLFFSGLSASTTIISVNKNMELLSVAMTIIFLGSLSNEILLDMRDKEGDKYNNIWTIPTIFGNKFSWLCSNLLLSINIIMNTSSILYLYNNDKIAVILPIIFCPLFFNLYQVKKDNYSRNTILNYMKYSNYSFVALLIYLCIIAKIK